MAGIKQSRAAHTGIITRNFERLKAMPFEQAEEVQLLKLTEITTIIETLLDTETGFSLTIEVAQELAPTEEEAEAAFQEEEQDILYTFEQTLYNAKALGEQLIACKSTSTDIATFNKDLEALQESLDAEPDQDKSIPLSRLQTLFFSMRDQWTEADLPLEHPLQSELDACGKKLTHMEVDILAARNRSLHASALPTDYSMSRRRPPVDTVAVNTSPSIISSKSSTPEADQLVATQPHNLSQCSTNVKSSTLEADQLVAGSQVSCSIHFKTSTLEADQLSAGSQVSCSPIFKSSAPEATLQSAKSTAVYFSKSSTLEADRLVAGSQVSCSTTLKSSTLEADLLVAGSQVSCSTTFKSSTPEADQLGAGSQVSCSPTIKSSPPEADQLAAGSQVSCSTAFKSSATEAALQSSAAQSTSPLYLRQLKPSTPEATLQAAKSSAVQPASPLYLRQLKSSTLEATLQSAKSTAAPISKSSPSEAAHQQSLSSSFATIQETRASCTATINKALDNLKAIPTSTAEAVSRLNTEDVKEILESTQLAESTFLQATENAQLFIPEADEDNLHLREAIIEDSFDETVSQITDLGKQLLFMKTISNGLSDLWSDLQIIRSTFFLSSRDNQVSNIRQLTILFSSLREKWQPANTPSSDPVEMEFDACRQLLAILRSMLSCNITGQGTQSLKSTLSTQLTSAPEKKPPAESQDTTSHHKPQKSQVDSVSAPTLPPPTIDCHPEVVAATNTEQSPCPGFSLKRISEALRLADELKRLSEGR